MSVLTISATHGRPAQPTEHSALVMLWERLVRSPERLVAALFMAPRAVEEGWRRLASPAQQLVQRAPVRRFGSIAF
jgi:hypothetical protein